MANDRERWNREMASQTILIGAAGEHYVLCELLRRGYIAALAPTGVPTADIVVTDIEGSRQFLIQVKTRRGVGAKGGWMMNIKHETIRDERIFYCFVDFQSSDKDLPLVYVVPSAVVATAIADTHQAWLTIQGKKGQQHKDNNMRKLLPDFAKGPHVANYPYGAGWLDQYLYAWDSLKRSPIDLKHPSINKQLRKSRI
ncbi:MAG: hypothetical protein ACRD3N_07625 [Terracidiphilus sp.]